MQAKEPAKIPIIHMNLTYNDFAEEIFPNKDPHGEYTLKFDHDEYIIDRHIVRHSNKLFQLTRGKGLTDIIQMSDCFPKTINKFAFEVVMRLLFGFKDVEIPSKEIVNIVIIFEELGSYHIN